MQRRTVITSVAAAAVLTAGIAGLTWGLSNTTSTSTLDRHSTTHLADGTRALASGIVAGRIDSMFHPLPWVGSDLAKVTCPALPARTGTSVTCHATSDGTTISIPVHVTRVAGSDITWTFDR